MALIDELRFSLRINTTDNILLNQELTRYINAAVLDLTNTTDIRSFEPETADGLLKDAVILYASFMFERDVARKQNYKAMYDDLKEKLCMSSAYSTLGAITDET